MISIWAEAFFFWEDENNWLFFLKTSETPINPIRKIQSFPWSILILRQNLSYIVPPVWYLHTTVGLATFVPLALFPTWLFTPPAPFHHFDIPNRWWCHIWTLPRMAMLGLWKLWRFKCSNPKFRIFLHKDKENNVNNVLQKMTMADSWVLQGLTQSCVLVKSSIKVEYWIPNKSFFAGKLESSMYKRFTCIVWN